MTPLSETNEIALHSADGTEIAVTAAGDQRPDAPVLLLLHGFPLDSRMWIQQFAGLKGFRILAVDFRGFGRTTLAVEDYSLATLASDVETVRRHLAHDAKVHLCGLSMGGYVALQYWRQHGSSLASLLLCNTKPGADTAEARAARLTLAERVMESGSWESIRGMMSKLLAHKSPTGEAAAQQTAEMMKAASAEAVAAASRAMADRADFTDALSDIDIPTLALTGRADTLCPPDSTEQWAKRLRQGTFEIVEEAGHLSPIENPRVFNATVQRFLDSVVLD